MGLMKHLHYLRQIGSKAKKYTRPGVSACCKVTVVYSTTPTGPTPQKICSKCQKPVM